MSSRILARSLLGLGGASLVALMAISVSDAGMRALDSPFVGAKEVSEACLALCVAIALPVSVYRGKAVTIDGVLSLVPPLIGKIITLFGEALGAVLCVVLAYVLIGAGADAADFAETTALLKIPYAVMYWTLSVGFGLTALAFLSRASITVKGAAS